MSLLVLLRRLETRLRNRIRLRGTGNVLSCDGARLRSCVISVSGNDNVILVKPLSSLRHCHIVIEGSGHRVEIGEHCAIKRSSLMLQDRNCFIRFGRDCTMESGHIFAAEDGHGVDIGADCMLSSDLDLRCSDSHPVVDAASGERLNTARNIKLGDHVWLGIGARVLKGAEIGSHTVVAAGSIVTGELPEGVVAGGIPAKPLRRGVTWRRERPFA